jgi:hypothetical protein
MTKNLKISFSFLFFFILFFNLNTFAQFITPEEGRFYSDNSTGKIYWCFIGRLRHVQAMPTYQGLFSNPDNYKINVSSVPQNLVVEPLIEDSGLINDVTTGIVYLRRGNFIHKIKNPDAFNSYHFNWGAITNVNGIAGYNFYHRGDLPTNMVSFYQWSYTPTW